MPALQFSTCLAHTWPGSQQIMILTLKLHTKIRPRHYTTALCTVKCTKWDSSVCKSLAQVSSRSLTLPVCVISKWQGIPMSCYPYSKIPVYREFCNSSGHSPVTGHSCLVFVIHKLFQCQSQHLFLSLLLITEVYGMVIVGRRGRLSSPTQEPGRVRRNE